MWNRRTLALLLAMAATAPLAARAQRSSAGSEFQVNTYTYDFQIYPAISADQTGSFVVVWSSYGQDYYYGGVFAQRFSPRGSQLGTEFKVNTQVFDDQYFPDVTHAPNGRFVVVWSSYYQDGDDFGVYAQRFGTNGAPDGTEFRVNTYTFEYQGGPAVASDPDGNFVVVWADETQDGDDFGIFGQRVASSGSFLGTEFQVNSYTIDYQGDPKVAVHASGEFVVTWTSDGQDEGSYGVFARRFASGGLPLGTEFQVSSFTSSDQNAADVAALPVGFVIAWQSLGQDGSAEGIFTRRVTSSGPIGRELQINTFTPSSQERPAVSADPRGIYTVTWSSSDHDGDLTGVFAAQFDSQGNRVGGEFQVNTLTTDSQTYPDVATGAAGRFVVTWSSFAQDGAFFGNFGQRFVEGEEPATCPGDCNADGTVTVDELIRGVNIALGTQPLTSCPEFDRNGDGMVVVNELILAVNAALAGCN